jgi:hypothetical protein
VSIAARPSGDCLWFMLGRSETTATPTIALREIPATAKAEEKHVALKFADSPRLRRGSVTISLALSLLYPWRSRG